MPEKIRIGLAVFIGLLLAISTQTNYRLTENLGLGEFGLGLFIGYAFLVCCVRANALQFHQRHKAILVLMGYMIFVLLPVTLVHDIEGYSGSSFRDWLAYMLAILAIVAMVVTEVNTTLAARAAVIFCLLIFSIQYVFGGEQSWYYAVRFTGGAKNPNQLALAVICCVLLTFASGFGKTVKLLLVAIAIFFGVLSVSDAFFVFLVCTLSASVVLHLLPQQYRAVLLIPALIVPTSFLVLILDDIKRKVSYLWYLADEGDTRLTLFSNGIDAWLSGFLSFFLGNGAGSFSGFNNAFEGVEAHNTPIDLLAIGGLLGLVVIYYLPVKNAVMSYRLNEKMVFAGSAGLIVYSLFHYIIRHPIYWFTLFVVAEYLSMVYARRREA